MKQLFIILCLGLTAMLAVKYISSNKEKAAKAAATSLLDAMKEKDVDRTMEYLEYDAVVSELDMWANIGGGNFGPDDVRAQLKKNLEKKSFDYEILDAESKYDGTVKVTVQMNEEGGDIEEVYFIMKKKDGKWKCDLMSSGREGARMEMKKQREKSKQMKTPKEEPGDSKDQ